MNDRYLFKAKRIDNGKWVQGYLFDDGFENGRMFVGGLIVEKYIGAACDDCTVTGTNFCEIDPSTICQYTGLKDKNGKLIWENDIVECLYNCYGEKFVYIGKIIYKEDTCRFVAANSESTDYEWWDEEKEVIGNIFDNPELVENKEN